MTTGANKPVPVTSMDVMQKFLVWINLHAGEHAVQQARAVHMHLYTQGFHIPGLPHSDLHAQWSKLESIELTDTVKATLQQFLEQPPSNKVRYRKDTSDK